MFWESKIFEDVDFLLNWQEFWRRSLNSYLEYGEQVSLEKYCMQLVIIYIYIYIYSDW